MVAQGTAGGSVAEDADQLDGLVGQAGRAIGWLAGRLPGARLAGRALRRVEDLLVAEARTRLELPVARGQVVELRYAEPLRVAMAELLERSVTDNRAEREEYFFEADPALSLHYELLLTDETVRAAQARARESGRPKPVRRSVRISELGERFWAACEPGGGEPRRIGP